MSSDDARFIAFFDRFCEELADRAAYPVKMFGSIGPKCAAGAAGAEAVGECLADIPQLVVAIRSRPHLAPAPSAAALKSQEALAAMMGPVDRIQARYDREWGDHRCKFLNAASLAITKFRAASAEPPPLRLHRLATNSTGGSKLDYGPHLFLAASLMSSCRRRGEDREAAALVAAASERIASAAIKGMAAIPTGPIRRHRTASSSEGTRKRRTRAPSRRHRTASSSEGTRRSFRRRP